MSFDPDPKNAEKLKITRFVKATSYRFKRTMDITNSLKPKLVCITDEWVHMIDYSGGQGANINVHSLNPFDGSY